MKAFRAQVKMLAVAAMALAACESGSREGRYSSTDTYPACSSLKLKERPANGQRVTHIPSGETVRVISVQRFFGPRTCIKDPDETGRGLLYAGISNEDFTVTVRFDDGAVVETSLVDITQMAPWGTTEKGSDQ